MKITSFRGKTAMLSTEIMEKNEQLGNDRPRQGTVPCPIGGFKAVASWGVSKTYYKLEKQITIPAILQ